MGIPFKDIVVKREIDFPELKNKKLAFDGNNVLYQFLSAIRGPDGYPLTNSEGKITSHLMGLFSRTIKLMEYGIKPVFVFDGKPPELKYKTTEKRRAIKEKAAEKLKAAEKSGDLEAIRKFAQQTTRLTGEMIAEAKELLRALGIPVVQALADGEAMAAILASKGSVWAVASQDYDALLYGSPKLVRNLTISQRRKVAGTRSTVQIKPEIIDLNETLLHHGISRKDLINAAILIGTDFNSGIRGIGPKTSMKIVKEGRIEEYHDKVPRHEEVSDIFLKPVSVNDYSVKSKEMDEEKIIDLLVNKNKFSLTRVEKNLKSLQKALKQNKQAGLADFI